MTNQFANLLPLFLLAAAALASAALAWKAINEMARCGAGGLRATERERRDQANMVMRLIEKSTLDPQVAARCHAQERHEETRMATGVERAAVQADKRVRDYRIEEIRDEPGVTPEEAVS